MLTGHDRLWHRDTSIANLMRELKAKPGWASNYQGNPCVEYPDGSWSFQMDGLILTSLSLRAVTTRGLTTTSYREMMRIADNYRASLNL